MERRKVETRVQARRTESAPTSQPRDRPNKPKRKETETSNRHQGPRRRYRWRGVVEGKTVDNGQGGVFCQKWTIGDLMQSNCPTLHVDSRARHYRQSGLSDAMPQTECPPGKESTEAPTSNPHGTWPRCLSATRPAEVVRRLSVNPTCHHKTAHRLPCSVLFAHPDRRFRHCVNGPPFCDDKRSGGGVETRATGGNDDHVGLAGWGSRRGGVCENPSHPWQAGRGAQRGLTRRKDAQKDGSTEGKGRNRRPGQAVSGRARGAVTGRD